MTSHLPTPFRPPGDPPPPSPPRPAHGPDGSDPDGGPDWRRVLSALLRFKWVIAAVTVAGTAAGVLATRFLRPDYLAQATIWIDVADRRGADRGPVPIRPGQLLDSEAWVDLIESYVVLDQVVRDQRLYLERESPADEPSLASLQVADRYRPGAYRLSVDGAGRGYTLSTTDGIEVDRGTVGDSIGVRLGLRWAPAAGTLPAGHTIAFALATVRDAARRLAEDLDARMDMNGNFLRVELRGPSPARITAIINAVVERYVEVAADLKRRKVGELTKILSVQVDRSLQNLRAAESALEAFRVQTITLPADHPGAPGGGTTGDARDPVFANFFGLELEREQTERDREALERLLAQGGDGGVSGDALSVVAAVQRSPELSEALRELTGKQADLRALRYRYSDDYPLVRRLAGEIATLERQTIPALARALVGELTARETELGRRVATDARTLRRIPARAIEEARLRRTVALAENLYTTLQQRFEESRLAEASTVPDVRILDSAVVPSSPVKNTAPRVVVLAFLGSFALAVVGAVLADRADRRVRYPDQVSREMGLAILGAVPHVPARVRRQRGTATRPLDDVSEVVESLRGVCLNLVYSYGAAGPVVVTVTSPGPGDGKSFIAANLAHTFAEAGHRTLLIDADIRRGVLHRRLDARRQPGLTEYLRGEAPGDSLVQRTPYRLLSLIGCGTRAYNAPELLGSAPMSQLVNAMRSSYDVLLIDSPPLGAGVDALILGTVAGSMVLVLRTGYSHRDMASAKLEVIERLPVRLLGAVLNDVPAGAAYRDYRYYSYYLPGYEAVEEGAAPVGGARPRRPGPPPGRRSLLIE